MKEEKLKQDIEFIKQMAQEGRKSSIKGNEIGVFWGIISFIMILIHWGAATSFLPISLKIIGWFWLAFIIIGNLGTFILVKKLKNTPGFDSINNKIAGASWMLVGAGIIIFSIGIIIAVYSLGAPFWMFNLIFPVALICYAIANGIESAIIGHYFPAILSALCFIIALIMFPLLLSPTIYLIAAFATLIIGVLPAIFEMVSKNG